MKFPRAKNGRGCECGKAKSATIGIPGDEGDERARWCSKCPGATLNPLSRNIVTRRCECGETATPHFGFPGDKHAKWCKECRPESGSINLISRKCECGKACPYLGVPGGKALYCTNCPNAPSDIVHLYKEKCHCGKIANFGLATEKRPRWCKEHKEVGAIDIRSSRCPCGNSVQPCFGFEEDQKAKWCQHCCPDGAINLRIRKCEICNQNSCTYGEPSELRQRWCKFCKPTDSIFVYRELCVVCKEHTPRYGLVDGIKSLWCEKCKPEDAIMVSRKACKICNKKRASYGLEGGHKAIWCFDCKPTEAIANRVFCIQDHCTTQVISEKYRGNCARCFAHLYPDEPMTKRYRIKERCFVESITQLLTERKFPFQFDKRIPNGTSQRRPDVAINCGSHWIILELDEEQHNTKEYCECENKRMMELFEDCGNRPIVFVRINPDKYMDSQGTQQPSCFYLGQKGDLLLNKVDAWDSRMKTVRERVEFHMENVPEKEVTVEHLYYNGFH